MRSNPTSFSCCLVKAKMASRSWLLVLALAVSFLGTMGSPSSHREERYANRITQLQIHVEDLKAASKTQATSLQSKDKETRVLKKELQQFHAQLAAATKTTSDLNRQISKLMKELDRAKAQNSALLKRAEIAEAHAFQMEARDMPILVETINKYKSQLKKAERAPWLLTQTARLHSLVTSTWATHGASLLGHLRAFHAQNVSNSYMPSNRNVPVMRCTWENVRTLIVPQLQRLKMVGMQYLEAGKKYLSPHLSKVQESVAPDDVQTGGERDHPFVEQAADILSPNFERANTISGPSVQKAKDQAKSEVPQASTSHEELQDSVEGTQGKHEVLARWATKELIWFLASALLVLPVVASFLVYSSVFKTVKNPIKPQRPSPSSSHSSSPSGNRKPCQPKTVDIKQEKWLVPSLSFAHTVYL